MDCQKTEQFRAYRPSEFELNRTGKYSKSSNKGNTIPSENFQSKLVMPLSTADEINFLRYKGFLFRVNRVLLEEQFSLISSHVGGTRQILQLWYSGVGELRPLLSQHHKESFISEKPEDMLNEVEDAD